MKEIYLVLTYTGTILSKIVKFYTKKEYSHVSISLDKELNQMYSFGRLNPYNAFIGGFVHEYVDKGTFKRFYKTKAAIYRLEVSKEQYQRLIELINKFEKTKDLYSFNTIGLFAVALNIKIKRKRKLYCAEFIKYLLENAEIVNSLPEIIKPEDFAKIKNTQKIYTGKIQEYRKECCLN